MISFVWSDPLPLYSGRGGTESYTIGHVRELQIRGFDVQILSYGLGTKDGRRHFRDITFRTLKSLDELSDIDGTIVYLNIPHNIPTKQKSFVMFHFPAIEQHGCREDYKNGIGNSAIITNSRFLRSYWADYLDIEETTISIVYPFADPAFSKVKRPKKKIDASRILYAGRLSPEKGIYTLLESLHHPIAAHRTPKKNGLIIDVVAAGNQTVHGKIIARLLRHHPWVNLLPARHTPHAMAKLFAEHDVVVMPSNNRYWHEAFGMVSVEAQHAGCRVIASNDGGLPETNCGELLLFSPGNSYSLYKTILKAAKLGPLEPAERAEASKHFTLSESVDNFLHIIGA
jgi:glycosyltransferase involved in cell wall biosynthesis